MNADEARDVLRLRSVLVRIPYGEPTIHAWANALYDVDVDTVKTAVTELANAGTKEIEVATIRGWLRDKRAAQRRADQVSTSALMECGCTLYTLCDQHRAVGLAGVRQARQIMTERPAQSRWSGGKVRS